MKYQAVIFDLDGTLLDTLEDLANAGNRVLHAEGFPVYSVDEYRYFVGDGLQSLVERILPEEKRSRDYGKNWKVKTRLYGGIDSMLDDLVNRQIRLNVLSNKPQDFTEACVHYFLSDWPFFNVFGQRSGRPKKPDPAGALELARLLGIDPSEVLYLGDTATDMITAQAAGMIPIGALWGFRDEEELKKNGAVHLLSHPDELLQLLSREGD